MISSVAKRTCLLMRRKDRLLALPVDCVSEVRECNEIFSLPTEDPRVSGLILSGNGTVPLLRLDDEKQAKPRIAILIKTLEGLAAIPADEVIRVESLNETPIPEMPGAGASRIIALWPGIVSGIGTIDQQVVLFLNPSAIINAGLP